MSSSDSARDSHPLVQMIAARVKEFCREPAAIFWVYAFPLIMMATLGLAFRNRPVERVSVDVVHSDRAEAIAATLTKDPRIRVAICDDAECRRRLRVGSSDLLVAGAGADGPGRSRTTARLC